MIKYRNNDVGTCMHGSTLKIFSFPDSQKHILVFRSKHKSVEKLLKKEHGYLIEIMEFIK